MFSLFRKKSKSPPQDYLYIDSRRLDTYIEQITSPSFLKIPSWSVELGLSGPKLTASQEKKSWNRTDHKKIEILTKYLRDFDFVAETAPSRDDFLSSKQEFILQTSELIKCIIPFKYMDGMFQYKSPKNLTLWINSDNKMTFLLEDCCLGDKDRSIKISSRSMLTILLMNIEEQLGRKSFLDAFSIPLSTKETTHQQLDSAEKVFEASPIVVLEHLGATIMPKRQVHTLYRVRDINDMSKSSFSIYGYPIFIAAK